MHRLCSKKNQQGIPFIQAPENKRNEEDNQESGISIEKAKERRPEEQLSKGSGFPCLRSHN